MEFSISYKIFDVFTEIIKNSIDKYIFTNIFQYFTQFKQILNCNKFVNYLQHF